jgi:hypothetical protein
MTELTNEHFHLISANKDIREKHFNKKDFMKWYNKMDSTRKQMPIKRYN